MSETQAEVRGENARDDEYLDWLDKKGFEFHSSKPREHFDSWMFRGFFETECAWRVRAEWRDQDQKRIADLEQDQKRLNYLLELFTIPEYRYYFVDNAPTRELIDEAIRKREATS